eukprot:TRINITY_DN2385_c0_g1_i1.p1 TRINITY_DN2385_c0_g1~~TRINITY_DN2385_c0_g1_i1.p1  ORF type:complete len:144 (+),score=13.27 TRINITY_DN2385_c0_g1_i1:53-484(+)
MSGRAKKRRLVAFSKQSWRVVCDLFKISPTHGMDVLPLPPTFASIGNDAASMAVRLLAVERMYGPINTGREAKKCKFIDVVIEIAGSQLNFAIDPERPLASDTHHGSVEYVMLTKVDPWCLNLLLRHWKMPTLGSFLLTTWAL